MTKKSASDKIMHRLNPNALKGRDSSNAVYIEDVWDCEEDARMYRIEYVSTLDGNRAIAFCRSNPWNRSDVNCGYSFSTGHVDKDGFICIGNSNYDRNVSQSKINLETTVERARFWCLAFSVLKETGSFPQP
ncbi:MAG: hypothetical protein DWB93_03805 [Candidatus Poseidoniales archaeon]|nr:MAG: hypothetical protein DWB93_03805 [Candidatus Poseidoniales archaeon]